MVEVVVVRVRLRDGPDSWVGSISSCKEEYEGDGEARDRVEGSTKGMISD